MRIIRNVLEKYKINGKVLIILMVLAILLAGALPVKGKNVFAFVPGGDVVTISLGYARDGSHYDYKGKENSWVFIKNSPATGTILLKFKEEPEKDIFVRFYECSDTGKLLEEQETVWKRGTGLAEMNLAHEDTGYVKVHIPADFTIDRALYAVPYQRYKRSAAFLASVLAVVLLGTLFFSWSRQGKFVICWLHKGKTVFFRAFTPEKRRKYRLEWATFILIVVVGGLYAFLEPPFMGMCPDDEYHYTKAIEWGHVYSSAISAGDYDVLLQATSRKIDRTMYSWEERAKYAHFLNEIDRRGYIMIIPERGKFRLSYLPYVPYAIIHLMLKTLHVPWTIRFMIGRWVYAWILAFFTALGMKRLKSGKLVAAMLSLTPGIIFLSGNYSYDTWITALYLYGLCCVFGELQERQRLMQSNSAGKIFGTLALAGIVKPVYFPIHAISFFMPRDKFKSKAGYWVYKLAAIGCVAFPIVLTWYRTFAGGIGVGDTRGGSGVNAAVQMQSAASDTGHFALVILNYLKEYLNPFGFGKGWANNLGYLGKLNIGGMVFILIVVGVVVSFARKEPGEFPWWYRLGLASVYVAVGAIVTISMYVMFTPVGADHVQGAQVRYLSPVMFPTIYGMTRMSGGKYLTDRRFQSISHVVLLGTMAAINIYAICSLCLAYY